MKNIKNLTKAELLAMVEELAKDSKSLVDEANSKGVIYRSGLNLIFDNASLGDEVKISDITTVIKYHALSDNSIKFIGDIKNKSGLMVYKVNNKVIEDLTKRITSIKVDIVDKDADFINNYIDNYVARPKNDTKKGDIKSRLWN